jgi:hypothetical protein
VPIKTRVIADADIKGITKSLAAFEKYRKAVEEQGDRAIRAVGLGVSEREICRRLNCAPERVEAALDARRADACPRRRKTGEPPACAQCGAPLGRTVRPEVLLRQMPGRRASSATEGRRMIRIAITAEALQFGVSEIPRPEVLKTRSTHRRNPAGRHGRFRAEPGSFGNPRGRAGSSGSSPQSSTSSAPCAAPAKATATSF